MPLFYNEFKKNDVSDKYKKIKLIIQYYDEDSLERRIEIIKSIQNNIDSNHFSEIVMFIETRKNRSYEELCSDFKNTNKVRFIETESRITFEMAFDISKKDNDTESVYLLTNNDCYFDDTVNLLKKVNYENGSVLVCMTRKDYTEIGDIDYAVEPGITKPEFITGNQDRRSLWQTKSLQVLRACRRTGAQKNLPAAPGFPEPLPPASERAPIEGELRLDDVFRRPRAHRRGGHPRLCTHP